MVTILVLAQSGFLNEFHSPVDLTYLADTVINLRHFEARGAIRQAISVAKKRSGGHENTIREFKVSTKGLWVGEQLLQFRGVLTGVPVLESKPGALKKQETEDLDAPCSAMQPMLSISGGQFGSRHRRRSHVNPKFRTTCYLVFSEIVV